MSGRVWVVLGLLVRQARGGVTALPLLARRYVRQKDVPKIDGTHRPEFRTERAFAVELLRWALTWRNHWGKPLWVAADGADATAAFLKPMKTRGVTVVSRLRKDSALGTEPGPRPAGRRGRPRVYGPQRISRATRAGRRRGRTRATVTRYGKPTETKFKTFVATWRPAGGAIRVVRVDEPTGGVAFFCSDPTARVADVLEAVADRFSRETAVRDVKAVVGAGRQQVRFVWANLGAFHSCRWTLVLTEAWAWRRGESDLVGHRSASRWDDEPRRPSHADQRRAGTREWLSEEIRAALRAGASDTEIAATAERLLDRAA